MSRTTAHRQDKDQERKAQTRELLLDAAERVFARQGYHPTRISDIVGVAGMGQGTFYRQFESKESALSALLDRLATRLLSGFQAGSASLPQGLAEHRRVLLDAGKRAAETIRSERTIVLLILREGAAVGGQFQQRLEGFYGRMVALADLYLRHGVERGYFRPCNVGLVAQAQVGQLLRVLSIWLDNGLGDLSVDDIVQEMVELAMMGSRAPRPTID